MICVAQKTTKLVQVSTIACLPSAMLEQHGLTCSSRLARHVKHLESCRDVTWWAKWNLGLSFWGTIITGYISQPTTSVHQRTK